MVSLAEVVNRIRGRNRVEVLRARFERFRHLLDMDNRVLWLIGDANSKLAGEYLFDTQYLRWLEEELAGAVTAVVQDLADMSGNRYPGLAAARDRAREVVRAALESRSDLQHGPLVVGLDEVGTEAAETLGEKMARLCEVRNRLGLRVPDGVVTTARASQLLLADPRLGPHLDALEAGGPATPALQETVAALPVPPEVDKALRRALANFDGNARFAVRSSAIGEDGVVSFAGQYETILNVPRDEVPEAWRRVVSSLFSPRALDYRQRHGFSRAKATMAVGCLLMTPAVASGVTYTVDPADPESLAVVVSATFGLGVPVVEGTQGADRYTVSRSQPHHVSKRAVASKHAMYVAASERGVESVPVPADRRNEPVLTDDRLDALVRVALQIERHMRGPQDVEWALEADGTVTVLQARPLRVEAQRPLRGEALATTLARYRVLMRDQGEVACRGVGSGRVVIAAPDGRADGFEPGDVLVARYASPRLSALVSSASAVVTDVGAVTGHMATVAREYRVPTIVGSGQATQFLEAGTVVTVDADDHVIYEGAVQELLRYQLLHGRAYQETHQFRVLRRVLNLVAPLSLGDSGRAGLRAGTVPNLSRHRPVRPRTRAGRAVAPRRRPHQPTQAIDPPPRSRHSARPLGGRHRRRCGAGAPGRPDQPGTDHLQAAESPAGGAHDPGGLGDEPR